jgi:uncharacterized BrkB/YihY/UPF0761 family membrane protein
MGKDKGFFDTLEAEVVNEAKNYVKRKVTDKLVKIGEISVLVFMAFVMISFGLGMMLGHYVEILSNGLSYIVLGVVFLLLTLLFRF